MAYIVGLSVSAAWDVGTVLAVSPAVPAAAPTDSDPRAPSPEVFPAVVEKLPSAEPVGGAADPGPSSDPGTEPAP